MRRLIVAGLIWTTGCLAPASARVERLEMSRQAFAAGAEFGPPAPTAARARLLALDPDAAANAPIADLKLAPRNDRAWSSSVPNSGAAPGRRPARQRHAALRGQQPRQYRDPAPAQ
jgi:hypothetical protein